MKANDKILFLRAMDSAVWVEKRLYPARLIVLDELEGNADCQAFVTDMLNEILCLNSGSNANPDQSFVTIVHEKSLSDAVIAVLQQFRGKICDTTLAQFLKDLETFGLREALAYLHTYDIDIPDRLRQMMLTEYRKIGTRFNARSDAVRSELQKKFENSMHHNDISDCLSRLIALPAIDAGDVWHDGSAQTNYAESKSSEE